VLAINGRNDKLPLNLCVLKCVRETRAAKISAFYFGGAYMFMSCCALLSRNGSLSSWACSDTEICVPSLSVPRYAAAIANAISNF
jgi:hypothetical protein